MIKQMYDTKAKLWYTKFVVKNFLYSASVVVGSGVTPEQSAVDWSYALNRAYLKTGNKTFWDWKVK